MMTMMTVAARAHVKVPARPHARDLVPGLVFLNATAVGKCLEGVFHTRKTPSLSFFNPSLT